MAHLHCLNNPSSTGGSPWGQWHSWTVSLEDTLHFLARPGPGHCPFLMVGTEGDHLA